MTSHLFITGVGVGGEVRMGSHSFQGGRSGDQSSLTEYKLGNLRILTAKGGLIKDYGGEDQ